MTDLEAVLGAAAPAEFAALSDEQRAHLADALKAAADARVRLIDRAIENSLRSLPWTLRVAVKRTLGM